jgi:hypothetical protein
MMPYRPYADKAVGVGASSTTASLHSNSAARRRDVLVISDED